MEANSSSAAMTALGLSNINAVPRVAMKDLVTKNRRHVTPVVSMTIFDPRDDAAAVNAKEDGICAVRPKIDGKFGPNASHSPRTKAATTMENDALVDTDTMVMDVIVFGGWCGEWRYDGG